MIDSELAQFFEVQSVLGRGTAGVVLKAYDRQRQLRVAIKQFTRQDKSSADFFKELIVANRLVHLHLVRTLHMFLGKGGTRYIIYEFMDKGSLRTRMKRGGPISPREAVKITLHCLRGLAFAHDQHIVHCDIKPENILCASDPSADGTEGEIWKLTDFGLAQNLLSEGQRASSVGTPAYMAPEQFYDTPTTASDLYAIGVVLFEMLAGRRPFTGDPNEISKAHAEHAPPLELIVDAPLRTLVGQLLAKSPADRPASAQQVMTELEALHPELPGGGTVTEEPAAGSSDSTLELQITASCHAETALLSHFADATRLDAMEMKPLWETAIGEANPQLLMARNEQAGELLVVGERGVTRYAMADGSYLGRIAFEEPVRVSVPTRQPWLFVADQSRLRQTDLNGEVIRSWPLPPGCTGLAVSNNGDRLVLAYADHIRFMHLLDRQQWKLRLRNYNHLVSPVFTSDGVLACAEGPIEPRVVFLDANANRVRTVPLPEPISVLCPGHEAGVVWVAGFGQVSPGTFALESVPIEGETRELRFDMPIVRAQVGRTLLMTSDLRRRVQITDLRDGHRLELKVELRLADCVLDRISRTLVVLLRRTTGLLAKAYTLGRHDDDSLVPPATA